MHGAGYQREFALRHDQGLKLHSAGISGVHGDARHHIDDTSTVQPETADKAENYYLKSQNKSSCGAVG